MPGLEGKKRLGWAPEPPLTRIAIPDEGGGFDVFDVAGSDFSEYASRLTDILSQAIQDRGAEAPSLAIREVIDNLVHALPCSVSVVVDPGLGGVFISDTGPGISRLDLAFELGYSTASDLHRSVIRGVGIGLFMARREMRSRGGDMVIESSPGGGTYVHLTLSAPSPVSGWDEEAGRIRLTQRQNNILFLLSEGESLGPSRVSSELNVGVSTAHRDLVKLQEFGLIYVNSTGKRFLSEDFFMCFLQG